MKKDKHSEDIDFTHYDHINDFTIGEIAKLWCGIDIYAPIPTDKLPKAKAIGRKIIGAIMSGDLKSKMSSSERSVDRELIRINYEIIGKDMTSHVLWATSTFINKNDLVNWANANKHKPKFLFHGKDEINTSTSTKLHFPLDTKWEDMTWIFISDELVRVEAKGVSKKYLYSDLGFTDKRKGDSPDTRWAILRLFAERNGEITWKSGIDNKEKNRMTAAVRDIRKRLKDFFNIDDDPFHNYRKTSSYKTKFTIKDNRHNENTDDSELDGFSEEEVKEQLNNSQ